MPANPEIERYIRDAARARGIDENVAVAVSKAEALNVFDPTKPDLGGDDRSSFGPFQLHYGGRSAKMPNAGLGDEFTAKTGLDASDPSTWKQQVDFSLDHATRDGWRQWMGAANTGIDRWAGIKSASGPVAAAGGGAGSESGQGVTKVASGPIAPPPPDLIVEDYSSPLAEVITPRVGPRSMLDEGLDKQTKSKEFLPTFDFGGPTSNPPAVTPPAADEEPTLAAAPSPLPLGQLAQLFKLSEIGGAGDEGMLYDPRRRPRLPTQGYG